MSDLPKGWVRAQLNMLCTITTGRRDVNEGASDGIYPFFTCAQKIYRINTAPFEGESILVAGNGFFNVKYYNGKFDAYQRTYVLQDFHIDGKFLYRHIQYNLDDITKDNRGSTVNYIRLGDLADHVVSFPPLPEQRRIIAKLEKLLHKVDASKERLDKIPAILKRFRQSVLAAACSGRLTADWREKIPGSKLAPFVEEDRRDGEELPEGWRWVSLQELVPNGGIFDGPFGSNLKTSDYTNSGVRVIRLENIGHLNFIEDKRTYISDEKYRTLERHTVGEGDIIFSSFISDEIRVCILPRLQPAIAKADCFCIRPMEDLVDRVFLTLQLACRESYNALLDEVHGATRPRINTTQLKKLYVRFCSLPEQQEIVRRVEALFKKADDIETRYNKAKGFVDGLPQSILAKAFRGELVPQDPNDEPAEVLIERIQEEKAKLGTVKDIRGKKETREPAPVSKEHTEEIPSVVEEEKDFRQTDINNVHTEDIIYHIRQAFRTDGPRDRETAIRDIADQLGYHRVGPRIRERLDNEIRTAVHRGILNNEKRTLSLLTHSISEYDRAFLKNQFLAAIGRGWTERKDAARLLARWLGFVRTGPNIEEMVKSIINGLRREARLEINGRMIRRR